MTDYRVIIPDEDYQIAEFRQEDVPGVAVINRALREFEPKVVFSWHLSVMIRFVDLIDRGMPSQSDRDVVDPFGDMLDSKVKGDSPEKPNALFLARITWKGTRELIYRVFDPEPADAVLREVIEKKTYPREFDYRIDDDAEWKLASWHLSACVKND
jgi:hypothetical protein